MNRELRHPGIRETSSIAWPRSISSLTPATVGIYRAFTTASEKVGISLENFGAAPIDSEQAIAELERLKHRGAAYLVLTRHQPWWWSERYDNFWSYLDSRYPRVRNTDDYVIFALGNAELAKRPVVSATTSKFAATF